MYQDFIKLDKDIVRNFLLTGKSDAIASPLQRYILQINRAIELHNVDGNILRCARKLQESFPGDEMGIHTARSRIYDAINVFHLNNTVRNQAWDNYYADQMDDLKKLCVLEGKYKEALMCIKEAHQLRTNKDEDAFTPEQLAMKPQLLSPDIKLERIGIKNFNKKKLWAEGLALIEQMNLEKEEKTTLQKEFEAAIDMEEAKIDEDNGCN